MPQCEAKQAQGIRCVLEEEHAPFVLRGDGTVVYEHNFGGDGPYKPGPVTVALLCRREAQRYDDQALASWAVFNVTDAVKQRGVAEGLRYAADIADRYETFELPGG